ncbi:MAG TPA: segregation/condensation protein A [Candidatus Binatia bacterium]|nr:segregation/condensation protein A [Candidatus Binatia bacterium]
MTAPCTVELELFRGPLDLLLHLIKKNEVQITDIPIATITDQYLALLEQRPDLNLDGAGEYLVMAATLMVIKSRMLLPEPAVEDDEPEEDPRADLVRQLLEYQRFREAAAALGDRPILARDVFANPPAAADPAPPGEAVPATAHEASLGDLLAALREVLARRRPPPRHEVGEPERSIAECVRMILARFTLVDEVDFADLFAPEAGRHEVIATFLALLELIRVRVVRARQEQRFGAITLALAVADVAEATARVRETGHRMLWGGGDDGDGNGRCGDR